MAKTSLIIGEDEKYNRSPEVAMPGDSKGKGEKKRKFAPSIRLTASQVAAFGLEDAKVGQKGSATIDYVVKSAGSPDSGYGDEMPTTEPKQEVSIAITHVDPSSEEAGEGPEDEGAEGEEDEDDEAPKEADSGDEDAESEDTKPKAPTKETMSPAEALGDED